MSLDSMFTHELDHLIHLKVGEDHHHFFCSKISCIHYLTKPGGLELRLTLDSNEELVVDDPIEIELFREQLRDYMDKSGHKMNH